MKIRVPLIFRNIVLRLLLMSALSGLVTGSLEISALRLISPFLATGDISVWVRNVVLPLLVILHHTLRLWPRKYWLVICEVVFSLMEVVTTGYFLAPSLPREIQAISNGAILALGFSLVMARAGSLFVIALSSFTSFIFVFCDILGNRGKCLLQLYDFSAGLCPPGNQWRFVLGSFVTRKRFSTDNRFIQSIRAVLAFLCLFALSALVIYALILQPFELRGRQDIKKSKISVINGDTQSALNMAIADPLGAYLPPLQAVLKVSGKMSSYPAMTLQAQVRFEPDHKFSISCQNSTAFSGAVLANCDSVPIPFNPTAVAEIFITINFVDMSYSQLYLGMTDSTGDVLAGAKPIDIIPGANLHGLSSILIKERISNQRAATFGIPQYRRFAVINVDSLNPDPSHSLLRDNRTTTLQIQIHPPPYIEIEQEYIESSVLNGFALVGGIWTLVNGLFAAIFGTTLLLVLFGMKPLSIYGLVHLFRPGRGSLADGSYSLSSEERDRIVGILKEHLLDVEGAEGDGASSSHSGPISVSP